MFSVKEKLKQAGAADKLILSLILSLCVNFALIMVVWAGVMKLSSVKGDAAFYQQMYEFCSEQMGEFRVDHDELRHKLHETERKMRDARRKCVSQGVSLPDDEESSL